MGGASHRVEGQSIDGRVGKYVERVGDEARGLGEETEFHFSRKHKGVNGQQGPERLRFRGIICSSNFRLFGDVNRCGFEESCAQTQGFPFLENACRLARVDNGDLSLRDVKGDGSDALGFSKTVRIRFFSAAQSILGTEKIVRWWLSAEVVAVENLLRYFLRSS